MGWKRIFWEEKPKNPPTMERITETIEAGIKEREVSDQEFFSRPWTKEQLELELPKLRRELEQSDKLTKSFGFLGVTELVAAPFKESIQRRIDFVEVKLRNWKEPKPPKPPDPPPPSKPDYVALLEALYREKNEKIQNCVDEQLREDIIDIYDRRIAALKREAANASESVLRPTSSP